MIRQTTFGIALSTVVLASGFTNIPPIPGHFSVKKPGIVKPASKPNRRVVSSTFKNSDLEKSVFEQVNRYRAALDLPPLRMNAKITKQARLHSQNMARKKIPFSHRGFERRVRAIPIGFRNASENVAFNQGYDDPVNQAIVGWLTSPGHLKNIKGNFNLTGIGVATNSQGEIYFTQIFIRSR